MNDNTDHIVTIKLNPTYPSRITQKRARRAWGQGLMSGLPFAEFVLLAGFLMAISMLVDFEHRDTAGAMPDMLQTTYTP